LDSKKSLFCQLQVFGDSVEEATTKVGFTKKTGYHWQKIGITAATPSSEEVSTTVES
jgi:hypothetical protein